MNCFYLFLFSVKMAKTNRLELFYICFLNCFSAADAAFSRAQVIIYF